MRRSLAFILLFLNALILALLPGPAPAQDRSTRNVVLVMTDGLRWQEVFRGADPELMNRENGAVPDVDALKKRFWRDTPEARREALLPFLWSTLGRHGQLWGNRDRGSFAAVTNGKNFSYPGYNETLTGFGDPRIDSNAKRNNPNVTVFEWLHARRPYRGRVAAFAAWDVFPWIFNRDRAGFPVNAGFEPLEGTGSPTIELLNRLKKETPSPWSGEPYDSLTFRTAMEYLKLRKPRVLFLSLGETDEWSHAGRYAEYLDSAHRADASLRELWETLQTMREYRGRTTLIYTTDHGRGDAPRAWRDHNASVPGSENIWMGFLGPDTPATGEQRNAPAVTQSQVAATLAAFLGEDYRAAEPRAAAAIPGVLKSRR